MIYNFRNNYEILYFNPSGKAIELQLPATIPLFTELYLNNDENILQSNFVSISINQRVSGNYIRDANCFYIRLRNDNGEIVAEMPLASLFEQNDKTYNKVIYSNVNLKKSAIICVDTNVNNNGKKILFFASYKN